MEDKINCVIELVSMSGQNLKDEDDIWEFLKRKGLCVSKTFFYYHLNILILKMMTKTYPKQIVILLRQLLVYLEQTRKRKKNQSAHL